MADARKRAEEALRTAIDVWRRNPLTMGNASLMADAAEALLAETGGAAYHATVYAETVAARLNRIRVACSRDESDLAAETVDILDDPVLAPAPSPASDEVRVAALREIADLDCDGGCGCAQKIALAALAARGERGE